MGTIYREGYSMLSVEERAPYEKMARDHNDRQGFMVEACVDALKVNSQRSWVNLSKVCMLARCIPVCMFY